MSEENDWTRALQGEIEAPKTQDSIEGVAVRKALLQRRQQLNDSSNAFNVNEFNKIKVELKELGLLKKKSGGKFIAFFAAFSSGIAATLTALQIPIILSLEPSLRGGDPSIVEQSFNKHWYPSFTNDKKEGQVDEITEIMIQEKNIYQAANFINTEAEKNGLRIKTLVSDQKVIIYLRGLDEGRPGANILKMKLGINPSFSGSLRIVIEPELVGAP